MKLRPSAYTPKPDQAVSIAAILDKLQVGTRRVLFLGATGSGKTVIASEIKRALYPAKMLFAVHRDRLIFQTIETLRKAGIPLQDIGVIAGKYQENRYASIQIISIQTAARRNIDWFDWKYLFFDEGHTTGFSTWGKKVHHENPHKTIIHLTATPWRLSKKECYEQLVPRDNWVFAPLPGKLMEMGRLIRCRYYRAEEIDTSNVSISAGDYAVGELSVAAKDKRVVKAGLDFFHKHYRGMRTIVFCVDVSHAKYVEKIARQKKYGRKTAIVTSETPIESPERAKNPREGTREYYYAQIESGEIDMLISVDCLSEGFDVPNIVCGWGLRPTKSWSKFFQQLGRLLRICLGKEFAVFLDQANNLRYEGVDGKVRGKFPFVEDLEEEDFYSEANLNKGDRPPARICVERDPYTWEIPEHPQGCGAVVSPKATVCPHCGYVLPQRQKKVVAGRIVALNGQEREEAPKPTPEELKAQEVALQMTFIETMDKAFRNHWSPGAAFMVCKERHGKHIPKNSDFYQRWVYYHQIESAKNGTKNIHTPDNIREWLEAVDRRKGEEGKLVESWLPRFFPHLRQQDEARA